MKQHDTRKLNITFSLTSSHTEVSEGESFSITINVSGPDAKEGLEIPYKIIGNVIQEDYVAGLRYGIFKLNSSFSDTHSFKIKSDNINEGTEVFTLGLLYYPEIQRSLNVVNIGYTSGIKPPEPVYQPPRFYLFKIGSQVNGGNIATFLLLYENVPLNTEIKYEYQVSTYTYPTIDKVFSNKDNMNIIKLLTPPIERGYIRVWLKKDPSVKEQIIIIPPA